MKKVKKEEIEKEIEMINYCANKKINWFKKRANFSMVLFWSWTIILGISSTSLPFFSFLATTNDKNWLVSMFSIIVAFSSFLLQIGNFHMLWKSYRSSEFSLKRSHLEFLTDIRLLRASGNDDIESYKALIKKFWSDFNKIESYETKIYFSTIKSYTDLSKKDGYSNQ